MCGILIQLLASRAWHLEAGLGLELGDLSVRGRDDGPRLHLDSPGLRGCGIFKFLLQVLHTVSLGLCEV